MTDEYEETLQFKEPPNGTEPQPRREGVAEIDYCTSYQWAWFDNDDLKHVEPKKDLPISLGWWYFYRGPGVLFGDDAVVRVSKYHTLVTRRCGRDI